MKTTTITAACLAFASLAYAEPIARKDEVAIPEQMGPRRPVAKPLPPRPPVPPPEVAKLGHAMAGTYKCKGVQLRGDGSSQPLQATLTIKLDLGDAWIQSALAEDQGGTKLTEFRTYDAVAKQWTRIQVTSTTMHVISTSLGEKDGSWTWDGTATSPTGTEQLRDHEQLTKDSIHVWGEALASGTWQKQYEATCHR
jgi:hypothetical protein